jgi:diguanylate cyclase (GGDEF)-like protein
VKDLTVVDGTDAALMALAGALLEHNQDAITVLRVVRDATGDVVDFVYELVNDAAVRNAGKPLLGRLQTELYPDAAGASMFATFRHTQLSGEVLDLETRVPETGDPATAGRTYHVYARTVGDWLVCQFRDLTELRATQAALEQQALHDVLTGLANRRLLRDHVEQALARLPRHGAVVGLFFCDLDDFKAVNDTLGHAAGDDLLQQVARRLRGAVRPEDTVARIGGDEFVVLSEGLGGDEDALAMATRMRDAVVGRYRLGQGEASVGMSIGIATTEVVLSIDQILSDADAALYVAKRSSPPLDPPIVLA